MPTTLTSPYPDDETRTKLIEQILEKFIEDNWDDSIGVTKAEIAWGKHPTDLLQSDLQITLRVDWFYTSRKILTPNRTQFKDYDKIDIYISNPELNTGRDPRGVKMLKFLEKLIITNQGDMPKGIYEWILEESGVRPDPEKRNVTRVQLVTYATYFADKIEV